MQVFLETRRLVLRRFTMADVDNLVSLDADPDVTHFVTGGLPTARDEIENEILPGFLGYYEQFEGYGFWAAIEKATGEFLGWFHFRPREGAGPGEAELGYRLCRSAWAASRRVMEKAGLTLVRTFHADWPYPIEGDELGDVEYALDRAEWERRRQAGRAGPGTAGEIRA
jgi:RimJ/RimL family protein N-acetyltransferase